VEENGTPYLVVYVDNINIQGGNINTIKKTMETLLQVSREVGLEVNTKKLSIWMCLVTKMQDKILIY
jgi:hypothetical protein